jgi:hypothetical protein
MIDNTTAVNQKIMSVIFGVAKSMKLNFPLIYSEFLLKSKFIISEK